MASVSETKPIPLCVTRREFLGLSGLSGLALALGLPAFATAESSSPVSPEGLTTNQINALYVASLNYQAADTIAATAVARRINFLPGSENETASNMCGPLAADILKSAGIIPASISSADFWLIDPRYRRSLLEKAFPSQSWTWITSRTPLVEVDFKASSLKTGDVIYNYIGSRYFFYHLLVITRVDEAGRAFSVTNYRQPNREYAIDEQLLYDPTKPGDGLFYRWASVQPRKLVSGQRDGYDLWRPGISGAAGK